MTEKIELNCQVSSEAKQFKINSSLSSDRTTSLHILKRSNELQEFQANKLLKSLISLSEGLDIDIDSLKSIVEKVESGLAEQTSYHHLIQLTIDLCASNITLNPDFSLLAGRFFTSKLHKESHSDFLKFAREVHENNNQIFTEEMLKFIEDNIDIINESIDYKSDFSYNYFAMRTFSLSYLIHIKDKLVERPQHLLMRVALAINFPDIKSTIQSYKIFSQKYYTHATPTLSSSAYKQSQMASCFLLSIQDDTIEGIFKTLRDCAILSKYSGGIGLSISNIRANGSLMKRTGKLSQGIIPMIKVFADMALYVNQGGNSRPGAVAFYLEPWHADIFDFLDLRKNQGSEERRARNIFTALWIPDLFMRRVESDSQWTLMCPNVCPGLLDSYGEEFEKLYNSYESQGLGFRTVKAREVWDAIISSQIETGTPYMCYKDAVNIKNNQKNLGVIHNSNLCAEIVEYSDPDNIAVCNLASLRLPSFVDAKSKTFDFDKLFEVSKLAIINLDKTLERNFYPLDIAKSSNLKNRPVGLGVQGLADCFMLLDMSFGCQESKVLNRNIFETIYYAALTASCELAQINGTYENYKGSPASQGQLSFDLWNEKPRFDKWDWNSLRSKIAKFGLRNSLLTTCMPTASTSNILGNNECIEPFTSNIYVRRVQSGEFQLVNQYLVKELQDLKLWNKQMKNRIIKENGSIQSITSIPEHIRDKYKVVWEISQKTLIDMAADRAPFIDQTQSLNIFLAEPSHQQITSMHFYGWKKGLKTGMYYLRTKPAANAIQFSLDKCGSTDSSLKRNMSADQISKAILCRLEDPEGCLMCGS